jgi:GNAT superfamily N-acetyltransferase
VDRHRDGGETGVTPRLLVILELALNPRDREEEFLRGLNSSFSNWGGADRFAWAFRRSAGAGAPDLLTLAAEGRLVSGTGISYRVVEGPGAQPFTIGILTGSWTLPAFRRRGAFSRLIEAARQRCGERGARCLLAFTTHWNPSFTALRAAGSVIQETWYLGFATGVTDTRHPEVKARGFRDPAKLAAAASLDKDDALHFAYPRVDHFAGQFLHRPVPTAVVEVAGALAILERGAAGETLLIAMADGGPRDSWWEHAVARLAESSAGRGLPFFAYTTERSAAETCGRAGFTLSRGAIHVFPAPGSGTEPMGRLRVDGGDRM